MPAPIRFGRPLLQWLADSDAGAWLKRDERSAPDVQREPMPHHADLMAVLKTVHRANRRADGSVQVGFGRDDLETLREWVDHIAYFTRINAGMYPSDRAMYNSARATLAAIDTALAIPEPTTVVKDQRWLCVKGYRKGVYIRVVGNTGQPEGRWHYENLSASRARQYGSISAATLRRNWELRVCHHSEPFGDCGQCQNARTS